MKPKGIVFDIQRFSLYDGPGIRTTVFLKGCPLRCVWCHNPESYQIVPQLMYKKDGDIKGVGYETDALTILNEVEADLDYYKNSGGGFTVSGGEPMLQFEFLKELLKLAKEKGIHTCIETCGYSEQEKYRQVLDLVDLFLFDIKVVEATIHKELTGVSNEIILSNLDFLYKNGASIILRCPLIPGMNDLDRHIEGIAELEEKYPGLKGIEILPYHDMGRGKWAELRLEYTLPDIKTADEEMKNKWMNKLRQMGCKKAVLS